MSSILKGRDAAIKSQANQAFLIYVLIILLFFSPSAVYSINNIDVSPKNLWYSVNDNKWVDPLYPQIKITAECNNSNIDEVFIQKSSASVSKIKMYNTTTPNIFSTMDDITDLYTLYNTGTYNVVAACGNETITTDLIIHNLKGSVENIEGYSAEGSGPIYLGASYLKDYDDLRVYVKLYDIVGPDKRDISIEEDIHFSRVTFLENTNIAFSDLPYYGPMVIVLKDLNDKGIANNTQYTLKGEVKYAKDGSLKIFTFTAKRPIVFGNKPSDAPQANTDQPLVQTMTLSHDSDIMITDETSKTINLKIITQNMDNFSISTQSVRAELYADSAKELDLDVASVARNGNDLSITVNRIPQLDPAKNYNIKIRVNYDTITKIETIAVRQGVVFSGELKDYSKVVVPATIEFNGPTYEKVSVSSDGRYRAVLIPGTYDLIITFTQFSSAVPLVARIDGVEITKDVMDMSPDPIKFSHISKNVNLDDMAVADLVDMLFALPFESATIKMPYDESKIYDDSEIEVFMCSSWNSGRKDCVGKWTSIDDIAINTDNNFISFTSDKLSAFVVSGKETLALQIDDFPPDYFSKEDIKFRGKVTDDNGAAIKGANINYHIKNTDVSGTTKTDISGAFEAIMNAPELEGKYELIVGAEKEPYHSSENMSFYVTVEKKKDLTLILPEISSIVLDDNERSYVKFKVKNSGQTELTNVVIGLSAQGLSREKYTLEPSVIDKLASGDEREATLKIPLTSEYCQKMGCMTVYSFSLQVKADQLKESKSANLIVEVKTKDDPATQAADNNIKAGNESKGMQGNSSEKGFFESLGLGGIAGSITSFDQSPVTGLVVGSESQSLNIYIILITIVLCFVIIALKKRRMTGMASSRPLRGTGSPSFNIIKKRIRGR